MVGDMLQRNLHTKEEPYSTWNLGKQRVGNAGDWGTFKDKVRPPKWSTSDAYGGSEPPTLTQIKGHGVPSQVVLS